MNIEDTVAQVVSIFVSALGLVVFRLIDRILPDDPVPIPRANPDTDTPESEEADGP